VSTSVSTVPFEQVFSVVWGPAPASVSKHAYYVSFIEVYQVFLNFQQLVERKFGRKIITMQTDWVVSMKNFMVSFKKLPPQIMSHALIPINRTVLLNADTSQTYL
jgi:hypothetical protein